MSSFEVVIIVLLSLICVFAFTASLLLHAICNILENFSYQSSGNKSVDNK